MPRGLKNWTYKDVQKVLVKNGFEFRRAVGSHHMYRPIVNPSSLKVTVPFHGKEVIKLRTLKNIIEQSDIPKSDWL